MVKAASNIFHVVQHCSFLNPSFLVSTEKVWSTCSLWGYVWIMDFWRELPMGRKMIRDLRNYSIFNFTSLSSCIYPYRFISNASAFRISFRAYLPSLPSLSFFVSTEKVYGAHSVSEAVFGSWVCGGIYHDKDDEDNLASSPHCFLKYAFSFCFLCSFTNPCRRKSKSFTSCSPKAWIHWVPSFMNGFICNPNWLNFFHLQMGTNYKAALIPQRIRETIHGWGKDVRRRKRRLGIYTDDSTVHTDTSTVMSVEEYDDQELTDSPKAEAATDLEIELQPHTIIISSSPSPVGNQTSSRVGTPLLRPSASVSSTVSPQVFQPEAFTRSFSVPARKEWRKGIVTTYDKWDRRRGWNQSSCTGCSCNRAHRNEYMSFWCKRESCNVTLVGNDSDSDDAFDIKVSRLLLIYPFWPSVPRVAPPVTK